MIVNINNLNDVLKNICENISLVNSFYDKDVYEIWNTNEVKYGSVVFNVLSSTVDSNGLNINALLYYGDRLLEDKSNRNSICSDTNNVIGTIMRKFEDYNISINYPIQITYFEQKFADDLAGGYCNMTFSGGFDICPA